MRATYITPTLALQIPEKKNGGTPPQNLLKIKIQQNKSLTRTKRALRSILFKHP